MTCRPPISLRNALAQADTIAPNRHRDPESDGICADPRHLAGGTSDHIPDSRGVPHAVDVDHDPENGYDAHAWADTVRDRCAADGPDAPPCTYIISNHRIASAEYGWRWRPYTGDDPHESHAHYSIRRTTEAETWAGQWWQGDDVTAEELDDALVKQDTRFRAVLAKVVGEAVAKAVDRLIDQEKKHNEAARDRDAKLLAALDRIEQKLPG